ncbi:MAG: oligosaccharide flippase family protein [Spirochaetes bacterium]|nr:oligosaccharide flippase family protein [Spirochaetota bacterium]
MIKKLISASFGTRFMYVLFGFLASIVINRYLGPGNKGIFTLIVTLSTFTVMFFEFGLPVSNVYLFGKKRLKFNDLFHNTLFLYIIFTCLGLLFAFLFIKYNKNSIYKGINWNILFLAFILIPVEFLQRIFRGFIDALQKYKIILSVTLFSSLFSLVGAIIILMVLRWGVRELILLTIANVVISSAIIYINIKDHINRKIRISFSKMKMIVKFGFKNYLFFIASNLNYRLDFFIIAYFLKPYYVGLYSLSVKMAELLKELPISLNTILLPKISANKKKDVIYIINKGTRLNIFISVLIAIGFILFGKFLIQLFYTDQFLLSYWPLVILLPGLILFNSIDLLGSFFNLHLGKPMINFWVHFSSVLVNLILNIILIPEYKIRGAAFASAVSYSLNALVQYGLYMKYTKVRFSELFFITPDEIKEYYMYIKDQLVSGKIFKKK